MTLKLVEFTEVSEKEFLNYMEEWELSGERIIPSAAKSNNLSFDQLIEKWHKDKTDEVYKIGFVPATLYFLINENGRILGAIHLRHELNERLLMNGGHIGYGVRPSERRKGYASLMLNLLLTKIKKEGYTKVLITCDDVNIASAKTIENNNGILAEKVEFEGDMTRKYWVNL